MSKATNRKESNCCPEVKNIRRRALHLNPEEITPSNLILATLANPATRKLAVKLLPFKEEEVLVPKLPDTPLPRDNSRIPLPACMEPDSYDSIFDDDDELDLRKNPRAFVAKLYMETPTGCWCRQSVADDRLALAIKVQSAAKACAAELPAMAGAAEQLARIFFQRGMLQIQNDKPIVPMPAVIFSPPGQDTTAMLKIFAREMETGFEIIDAERTSANDLVTKVKHAIPTIVEAHGFLNDIPGSATNMLFSCYLKGEVTLDEYSGEKYVCMSRNTSELEEVLRRCYVVLPITTPKGAMDPSHYTAQELAAMLRNEQDELRDRHPYSTEVPAERWMLVNSSNAVILKQASARDLIRQLHSELKNSRACVERENPALTLRIPEKLKTCAILSLAGAFCTPRALRGAAERLMLDIGMELNCRLGEPWGAYTLGIGEMDGTVPAVLKDKSRPTKAWYEAMDRQICLHDYNGYRLSFELQFDHEARIIQITNISMREPRAVDGGRFLMTRPQMRFKDVVGWEDAKKQMRATIRCFRDSASFDRVEAAPRLNFLTAGAPGTGKTMLAEAFAGESGLPAFSVSAAELTSQKWSGWGGNLLREIIATARDNAPSLVIIDEIDAIPSRDSFESGEAKAENNSILNTLLVELSGISSATDARVVFIGCTNRPQDLDPALVRPMRFNAPMLFEPLRPHERRRLIEMNLSPDICEGPADELKEYITSRTAGGFTPAEIADLCNSIKLQAEQNGDCKVTRTATAEVIDRIVLGKKFRELSPEYRASVAQHESGHAVALRALMPERQVMRLTIGERRGSHGLVTSTEDDSQAKGFSRGELISGIVVSLAGPASEELFAQHWEAGADSDLECATLLASYAVSEFAIGLGVRGSVLGHMTHKGDPWPAEFQEQVVLLVEHCLTATRGLLGELKDQVAELSELLQEREDLGHDEIVELLGDISIDRTAFAEEIISQLEGNHPPLASRITKLLTADKRVG